MKLRHNFQNWQTSNGESSLEGRVRGERARRAYERVPEAVLRSRAANGEADGADLAERFGAPPDSYDPHSRISKIMLLCSSKRDDPTSTLRRQVRVQHMPPSSVPLGSFVRQRSENRQCSKASTTAANAGNQPEHPGGSDTRQAARYAARFQTRQRKSSGT